MGNDYKIPLSSLWDGRDDAPSWTSGYFVRSGSSGAVHHADARSPREAVASLLRRRYGWDIGPDNIALTSGSQTSFFYLFNLISEFGGLLVVLLLNRLAQ